MSTIHTLSRSIGLAFALVALAPAARAQTPGDNFSPWVDHVSGKRFDTFMDGWLSEAHSQNEQAQQMMRQDIIRQGIVGRMIIKQGGATTKLPATNYRGRSDLFVQAMHDFNARLLAHKMSPTDAADGRALAVAISYEVYSNGKRATPAQINKLRQWFRREMLADGTYQGGSPTARLREHEGYAVQAVGAYQVWRRAKTQKVDAVLQIKAWDAAKDVLDWDMLGADKVFLTPTGFQTLSKSNGYGPPVPNTATVTFKRTFPSLLARQAAATTPTTVEDSSYTRWISNFDRVVQHYGGKNNDVADAYAAAFAAHWMLVYGTPLNQSQYRWLHRAFADDVRKDAAFQSKNDEARQRVYENLGADAMCKAEQKKAGQVVKDDCYRMMKEIFAPRDLDGYRLTPNGFVPKH